MICHRVFFETLTKATLVSFPQKSSIPLLTTLAQFEPRLRNLMSHDSLSEDNFEDLWHDEAKVA